MHSKTISFTAILIVFFASLSTTICTGQNKAPIPDAESSKMLSKKIRAEKWFPKSGGSRIQMVSAAFDLLNRTSSKVDAATKYTILSEALRFSDKAREWNLSREILEQIASEFEIEMNAVTDWYSFAIRQKQPHARLSELVDLFVNELAEEHDLDETMKFWKANERQLLKKVQKSKSVATIRSCLPKLSDASNLLELRSAEDRPLWQGVSAIIEQNDCPAGIKLLATSKESEIGAAAQKLSANKEDFDALATLISALANRGDPNLQLAAQMLLQSRISKLSVKQIALAQNACFAEARQELAPDFSLSFSGPDSSVVVQPKVNDAENILYVPDKGSWMANGKFSIDFPKLPLINFVHDIEFTLHTLASGFRCKYGTFFNTRLYFEPSGNDKIRFTHRSAAGSHSNWKGTRTFTLGQKLRFTLYSICGEQFLVSDGRLVSKRSSPLQWLKYEMRNFGDSQVELTKSTVRPWLPGDSRSFELAVNQSDLLNCTKAPKIEFSSSELNSLASEFKKLKKKPTEKEAFVNGEEIAMQPINRGTFDRGKTKVKISNDFWISRHEISQLQWEQVMQENPATIQGNAYFPVDNITYQQVSEFCRLLNAREKKARRLPDGYVYRLPTENEWEYVARAGEQAGHSVSQEDFWHRATAACRYHAIGSSKPNAWGIFDMHGNVDEFVLDQFHKPAETPAPSETDPVAIPQNDGVRIVYRGGNWTSPADQCSSNIRREQTQEANPYRGFRVVLARIVGGS